MVFLLVGLALLHADGNENNPDFTRAIRHLVQLMDLLAEQQHGSFLDLDGLRRSAIRCQLCWGDEMVSVPLVQA